MYFLPIFCTRLIRKPRNTCAHQRAPSAILLRHAARLRIARKSAREVIKATIKIAVGAVHAQATRLRWCTRSPVRPTLNLKINLYLNTEIKQAHGPHSPSRGCYQRNASHARDICKIPTLVLGNRPRSKLIRIQSVATESLLCVLTRLLAPRALLDKATRIWSLPAHSRPTCKKPSQHESEAAQNWLSSNYLIGSNASKCNNALSENWILLVLCLRWDEVNHERIDFTLF
jgi:hypothetical protein